MNEATFCDDTEVKKFVKWLRSTLPNIKVHLNVKSSRFVLGGIEEKCNGMDQVVSAYRWIDDWKKTKIKIDELRKALKDAVEPPD